MRTVLIALACAALALTSLPVFADDLQTHKIEVSNQFSTLSVVSLIVMTNPSKNEGIVYDITEKNKLGILPGKTIYLNIPARAVPNCKYALYVGLSDGNIAGSNDLYDVCSDGVLITVSDKPLESEN
jgi:hypothetical protein